MKTLNRLSVAIGAFLAAWRDPEGHTNRKVDTGADARIAADWSPGSGPRPDELRRSLDGTTGKLVAQPLTAQQAQALRDYWLTQGIDTTSLPGVAIGARAAGIEGLEKPVDVVTPLPPKPEPLRELHLDVGAWAVASAAGLTEHQQRAALIDWAESPAWATHYIIRYAPYLDVPKTLAVWADGVGEKTEDAKAYFKLREEERNKPIAFAFGECQAAKHLQFQLQQMDRVGELPADQRRAQDQSERA